MKKQPKALKPKRSATGVIDSAKRVIRLIATSNTPGIILAHKKLVISDMLWKITEAPYGKHTAQLRSRAALIAAPKELRHEHVFTRKWLIARILENPADLDQIVERHAVACVVTKTEAKQLDKVKDREGWARYIAAQICVVRVRSDGSVEPFDLAEAEAATRPT